MRGSAWGCRRGIRLVALLTLASLIPACGYGERRQQADYVMATPDRLRAAGTAKLTMVQIFRPVEMRDTSLEFFPFPIPLEGEMDLVANRVRLVVADQSQVEHLVRELEPAMLEEATQDLIESFGEGLTIGGEMIATPVMFYDGMDAYFRKLADLEDARPWVRFDLSDVDDPEAEIPVLGLSSASPIVWLDLIAGALTGSVQRIGTEEVHGVETTHYEANLDREKAFRDLPEDRAEQLENLFEMMRASSIVVPAQIWLDDDGLPRRTVFTLEQKPSRLDTFELSLSFDLFDHGGEVDISVPGPDETVDVGGFIQLVREAGIG